jgi:hypothetical protein
VYALGDLATPMFPKTLWFEPDLTLIVRDYRTEILFAMGPGSVRRRSSPPPGRCICRCSKMRWTKWRVTRKCRPLV